jgi:hypothetical protein
MDSESPVILAGMHRSGTSLIAGFLHRSGIDMGEALVAPDSANPRGYNEDCGFVEFHTEILQQAHGSAWYAPAPVSCDPQVETAARALLLERAGKGRWGWKDPRTCLFLELWRKLAPDAKFVMVFRNPFAVVDSLHRREQGTKKLHWRARAQWLNGWLVYNKACLDFAWKYPESCFIFELEDLIRDVTVVAEELSQFLNVSLDDRSFKAAFKPRELAATPSFLRELRHLPQHLSLQAYLYYRHLYRLHGRPL